jgi:hypothetical protein
MSKTQWGIISTTVMAIALVASLFMSDTAAQIAWNIVNLFFN